MSNARCDWPSQRMAWWMRPGPEPLLGQQEAVARVADEVVGGHPHVVVDDLGVAAGLAGALLGMGHGRHVAQDVHARRRGRHDDHRVALVGLVVGVRHAHDDEEVGHRRVRGEPLVAVDDPLVAVAHRPGWRAASGRRRRRARSSRSSSAARRRAAAPSSASSGTRPCRRPPAARRCPSPVRCCRRWPGRRRSGPRISCIRPSLTWPNPPPPSSGGRWAAHRPCALTSLLQRCGRPLEGRPIGPPVLVEALEGDDLVPDEAAHPLELRLELGFGREVPGHADRPLASRAGRAAAPRGSVDHVPGGADRGPVHPGRSAPGPPSASATRR